MNLDRRSVSWLEQAFDMGKMLKENKCTGEDNGN